MGVFFRETPKMVLEQPQKRRAVLSKKDLHLRLALGALRPRPRGQGLCAGGQRKQRGAEL